MDLRNKFNVGIVNKTYQRIDETYKVNIFLGYNEDGHMSMVITEYGIPIQVKSSKIIDVNMKMREDGKLSLSFDLLDATYEVMFLLFCKDIIVVCEKAGSNKAVSVALIRWKFWKNMFGKKNFQILSKMEIKGLIGELLELKDFFIDKYGTAKAIESWRGPLLGHKDFEIENTWYEIKSVSESAMQVLISSVEQLESDEDGHLIVLRLEETSTTVNNSINLNKMVLNIIDMIEDPECLDLFRTKLHNIGYEFNLEYDDYNYLHKSTQCYLVNDEFPRLRRVNLNPSIGNVQYSILLDAINNCMEN